MPKAFAEIYTMRDDIMNTKNEIKIPSGVFYDGIEGYTIRVDRAEKKKNKKFNEIEEQVLSVIDGTSTLRGDNANKRIDLNSSARDYIAGITCKSIAEKTLPKNIIKAHKSGLIHWHRKYPMA